MKRPTAKDFDKGYIKSAYDAINKRDELIKALDRYIDHLEQQQVKKLNIVDVSKKFNENDMLKEYSRGYNEGVISGKDPF
tara:strand:- start:857 stop:1096 length:240 start_codon:yes stop_codon:yes gene_type:complete